jgi:cytochrome oxidase Cu insertion factor (SCO1/SenC/PrrC family)
MTRKKYLWPVSCLGGNFALRSYVGIVIIIYSFLYLNVAAVNAQLGPKEGADLAPTDLERVRVGDTAPDFTLEDMNGQRITLSEIYSQKTVVLVFYRGQW